jgi:glyoxylase-like metal-dependent hydrolase (beta-lactamase superfamily II)
MAENIIRVGDVEIMALSDGMLEFDLCNFFPTIPEDNWKGHETHLHDHHVRFNLGSYLIRADGRTILVDTGLGPRPKDTPDVPWGTLLKDFQDKGVRPDEVDMVVMTHLHRDHVGWNLTDVGGRWVPTFPKARYLFARIEYEHWLKNPDPHPIRRAAFYDSAHPVVEAGRADLIEDGHEVDGALTVELAAGHNTRPRTPASGDGCPCTSPRRSAPTWTWRGAASSSAGSTADACLGRGRRDRFERGLSGCRWGADRRAGRGPRARPGAGRARAPR